MIEKLEGTDDNEKEDTNNKHIFTVRNISIVLTRLKFLHSIYTLAALLVFGFLFVFCFQVILLLFLNLYDTRSIHCIVHQRISSLFSTLIFIRHYYARYIVYSSKIKKIS